MMVWFTKIAAQVVNNPITRVGSREGSRCDLVFYSGPLSFQILDPTLSGVQYGNASTCTLHSSLSYPQTLIVAGIFGSEVL
jgi:hypothetical protein